jgi:hypothetical protein
MHTESHENAVSPAIATILIVLITVVVAAAVAVVAMGQVENHPDYVVGLTAKAAPAGNDVVVTLYGSKNLPELVKAEVIDTGSSSGKYVEVWNGTAGTAPVGVPLVAEGVARPADDRAEYATKLWVTGTFADGTEQVLLRQAVTFRNVSGTGEENVEPSGNLEDYIDGLTGIGDSHEVKISIPTKDMSEYTITVTWKEGEEVKLENKVCDKTEYIVGINLEGNLESNKKDIFTITVKDKNGKVVASATYKITVDGTEVTIAPKNNP